MKIELQSAVLISFIQGTSSTRSFFVKRRISKAESVIDSQPAIESDRRGSAEDTPANAAELS
jgi:hypothetical protein